MLPSQDYWFSLVFKRLVGPRVLAVRVAGLQRKPQPGRVIRDKLRIYAHCTSYYKYVLQLNHLGEVCNLHLNSYCDFGFFFFFYLRLTDERACILIFCQWCVTLLWECPWRFRLKTGRCGFKFFYCVLLQTPEAQCLGKNKIPRHPIRLPINKERADTRSFTAQSL